MIFKVSHIKFILAAVFVCALSPTIEGQDLQSAYFIDNYTYSYRLNPAFTTKKNFIGGLISSVNAGSNSNVGVSTFFYRHDGELVTFMHKSVDKEEFLSRIHPINKLSVYENHNIASTGFWTSFKGKDIFQTFEINWRNNTVARLPYNLFSFLKGKEEDDFIYDLSNVSAFTQSYIELASGTAFKLGNLEVGARVKFLLGTNKIYMDVSKMYANLNGNEWAVKSTGTLTASGGGIHNRVEPGALGGYDRQDMDGINWSPVGLGGFGGAVDLGAKYEINEFINLSASLTDLGGILWKNKVNAYNDGETWILSTDDINLDAEGSIGHVLNSVVNKFKSMYEFIPRKKNWTTQGLTWSANLGAEFKMPFYKKMSVGLLGTWRNSSINRYTEARLSINTAPLKWLSFSINTAYTTYGWEIGGMVNVYAKKFSVFLGTDSYYYNMTPQLIPVYEANTQIVFGVNYLLTRNPFKRSR